MATPDPELILLVLVQIPFGFVAFGLGQGLWGPSSRLRQLALGWVVAACSYMIGSGDWLRPFHLLFLIAALALNSLSVLASRQFLRRTEIEPR